MRSCILFLVLYLTCVIAEAQIGAVEHLVLLHNGEEYTGKRLLYISPILKTSEFELDGRKFESNEIAFFRNNHGYFANLNRIHGDKAERYALRIRQGRVNLFEEIEMPVYGGDNLDLGEGGAGNEMLASGESFQYFTTSESQVKKASYKNLRLALSDNPASRKEMNMFRNYRYLQIAMVAAGAGLIGYEIHRQSDLANTTSDGEIRFTPMIALGVVLGGSSYFLESAKENAKWLAADYYNAPPAQ